VHKVTWELKDFKELKGQQVPWVHKVVQAHRVFKELKVL